MEENQVFRDLEINSEASANLIETSRWSRFLSILIFAGVGLMFLLMIFLWGKIGALLTPEDIDTDQSLESVSNIIMVVVAFVMVIVSAVVIILFTFLIKAAARIRKGLLDNDQYLFNSGLANLRNFFVMYGVLAIIQAFFSLIGLLAR
jgi:hypothetical protein